MRPATLTSTRAVCAPRAAHPRRAPAPAARRTLLRATPDDAGAPTTPPAEAPSSTPPPPAPQPTPPPQPRGPKDQSTTALVTGVVSVVIGVAYLLLVAALNNRGELLPPPPEAYGP